MNRRYIDFVPASNSGVRAKAPAQAKRVRATEVQPRSAMVMRTTVKKTPMQTRVVTKSRIASVGAVSKSKVTPDEATPKLGVIEDLNTHFVRTDVPKRPLSEKPTASTAAEAKAKKIKAKGALKSTTKSTNKQSQKPASKATAAAKQTYKPPKSPFINQNKVVKRPLSGNVYKKQVVAAVKEEPKGPVTIIAKPEKEKHIGIVVTIILTIILGAAAGTVAFLLLPK